MTKSMEFLTGCVIEEKSLSVDNVFVFLMIFGFAVPEARYQRSAFVQCTRRDHHACDHDFGRGWVVSQFSWVLYLFGIFLIIATCMLVAAEKEPDLEANPVLKFVCQESHPFPTSFTKRSSAHYWEWQAGFTPLLLVLILIRKFPMCCLRWIRFQRSSR